MRSAHLIIGLAAMRAAGSTGAATSSKHGDQLARARPRGHAPCLPTPTAGTGRARSDAAPGLSREATRCHAGRNDQLDRSAPRASRVASRRLRTKEAAMAHELQHGRKLARHRGSFLEGPTGLVPRAPGGPVRRCARSPRRGARRPPGPRPRAPELSQGGARVHAPCIATTSSKARARASVFLESGGDGYGGRPRPGG